MIFMLPKNRILLTISFVISFSSTSLFAQTREKVDGQHSSQQADQKPYLKPSGLIIPGAFLVYGGLKPVINDISKLDDKIWTHMQENYPGFHTNAADFLMWVPSASIYAIDAFHVKTQNTFKEHLIID